VTFPLTPPSGLPASGWEGVEYGGSKEGKILSTFKTGVNESVIIPLRMLHVVLLTSFLSMSSGCSDPVIDSARDVTFLGADHLVVAERGGGIYLSKDAGKTWGTSETRQRINELIVGANERIWGLRGWAGIHEESRGALLYSDDKGHHWSVMSLDRSVFIPRSFISPYGQEPVVLDMDGQVWGHVKGKKESIENWQKVGVRNGDGNGCSGFITAAGIYVSSRTSVWLSTNQGKSWKGKSFDRPILCAGKEYCFVIDSSGSVYRTNVGRNDWEFLAKVDDISVVLGMAATDENLHIAGEAKSAWKAVWYVVKSDGSVRRVHGTDGKQGYSVRISPDGRVWFVAKGLYIKGDSFECKKVWP